MKIIWCDENLNFVKKLVNGRVGKRGASARQVIMWNEV